MGKYRKILVAFDGSEAGENALMQAFTLANDEKSWITVATVVPAYTGDLSLVGVGDIHKALTRPGEQLLSRAREIATHEGALVKTVLEEGEAHEKLVDLAEAENCSVIVMGRRGRSKLEKALMGSVTARVIGLSQRDVLVVPPGADIAWKKILVATDGSKNSVNAVEKAVDFAKSYGGNLIALSVVDLPDELYAEAPTLVDNLVAKAKGYVGDVSGLADKIGVTVRTEVREGESYRSVVSLAAEESVDLIVMGSHGRTGLKRLLMGSVTEKVIGHAPCPVLVVKT